jgi:hypothetical protein
VLALLYTAHHRDAPLRSLTVMTTPVDLHQQGPLGHLINLGGLDADTLLDADGNVPRQVIFQGFKSLKPTSAITQYVDQWGRLWSDEYVAAHQAMIGWATDHIPLPGEPQRGDRGGHRPGRAFTSDVIDGGTPSTTTGTGAPANFGTGSYARAPGSTGRAPGPRGTRAW